MCLWNKTDFSGSILRKYVTSNSEFEQNLSKIIATNYQPVVSGSHEVSSGSLPQIVPPKSSIEIHASPEISKSHSL
jgi:hypothetical protein